MGAAVVPLVLTSRFVFDDVESGTAVSMTLVKRMPLFAWTSAAFAIRVIANSLVAGAHRFKVQLIQTAPTCDDPAGEFVGLLLDEKAVADSDPPGRSLFLELTKLPPFADLAIKMENVDPTGGSPAGSVTLSIDAIVRGRSFDRVEYGDGAHGEAAR